MQLQTGENKKRLERKPNHEVKVRMSKDRKYFIFSDITTWILPAGYVTAILENDYGDSKGDNSEN